MQVALTERDVEELTRNPAAEVRVQTATKVAGTYAGGALTAAERRIAEDIIEVFTRDIEVAVREALSHQLKACPFLPRRLGLALARDVESVAIPMLQYSTVFSDEDLAGIARDGGLTKQLAIARRRRLPESVADVLAESGREEVAVTLLANGGSELSEPALHRIIGDFGQKQALHSLLVRRTTLPPTVAERLVHLVSDHLCEYLVKHHKLPADLADPIERQAREQVVAAEVVPADIEYSRDGKVMVRHLWSENRLTPTMLLRALCEGKVRFFEDSIALLARIPRDNAAVLLRDAGPLGFKALYRRAALPEALYPVFSTAVRVVVCESEEAGAADREERLARIMDDLMERCDSVGPEGLDATLYRLLQ